MKTLYQTDAEGFFTGPVAADPSPLEPGVWLIPGGAVEVEPPAITEGQRAQWMGGSWAIIDPPLPEPEPEPTPEEILATYTAAIEVHVEGVARSRDYSSAVGLASYVASTNATWAAEAQAFVAWRDDVWEFALAELARVEAGEIPPPALPDLVASLPAITWPA